MRVFFLWVLCAAEVLVEKGLRGLAQVHPIVAWLYDVCIATYQKHKERSQATQMARMRQDIERIADAKVKKPTQIAGEIPKQVMKDVREDRNKVQPQKKKIEQRRHDDPREPVLVERERKPVKFVRDRVTSKLAAYILRGLIWVSIGVAVLGMAVWAVLKCALDRFTSKFAAYVLRSLILGSIGVAVIGVAVYALLSLLWPPPLPLRGHTKAISSVAFSPDGQRIVSGSHDKTMKIWDAQTEQEILTLRGHTEAIRSVAFSPDSKHIVSGSFDATVKLWDAETGEEVRTLKKHTKDILSVAFSPDSRRILSGCLDGVRVWDVQTGQETLALKTTFGSKSVVFSPDGRRVLSGGFGGVRMWDAQTGQETFDWGTVDPHTPGILSVTFSPDGGRIVAGDSSMRVREWDLQTAENNSTARL